MKLIESDILKASILIVDDQAANVALLEQTLAQAGYRHVSACMDSHRVGALHREHRYDLILLDLQMPGMNGFEVMQELQADADEGWLAVMVITAEPGHKLRALQAGARDFLSKPFDLIEVRTRIHHMLEVGLLYKRLARHNKVLEDTVAQRTAELSASEARYRSLTELACDWYWEQDANGKFTRMSGPVLEMLGMWDDELIHSADQAGAAGWNEDERAVLRAAITARKPFLDFNFSRVNTDGSLQKFQVSGEPIFGPACQFLGYRGIGFEMITRKLTAV